MTAAFQPVTIVALLATLVALFAFQAENITTRALHVAPNAVPILLQVYFNVPGDSHRAQMQADAGAGTRITVTFRASPD